MQTKDEIKAEYRIVTCDGLYRVQQLIAKYKITSTYCDGHSRAERLRDDVWVDLKRGDLPILTFYPDVVFQTDDVKLAKHVMKRAINKRYRAQEDAWQPID